MKFHKNQLFIYVFLLIYKNSCKKKHERKSTRKARKKHIRTKQKQRLQKVNQKNKNNLDFKRECKKFNFAKELIEKCRFQKENKKKLFENDFAFIIISLRFIIGVGDNKNKL